MPMQTPALIDYVPLRISNNSKRTSNKEKHLVEYHEALENILRSFKMSIPKNMRIMQAMVLLATIP